MLKKFKDYIKNLIDARIRQVLDEKLSIHNNPYCINFKDDTSVIYRPHTVSGGENIYVGTSSRIGKYAWLSAFDGYLNQKFHPKITIGNYVNIGNFSCITAIEEIIVEDGCLFSEYVYISDHYHGYDAIDNISPALQPLYTKGPVIIGENCFIGLRVCIMPGVTLGKHCVVGSNSVVTKSFPDYSMVAGTPAKLLKTYCLEKKEWLPI